MNELQDRLIENLNKLISFLNKYGISDWRDILTSIKEQVNNGDIRGVDTLKSMRFRGMGSLNDVVIMKKGNKILEITERNEVNEEFYKLKNQVFHINDELSRQLNKNSA